MSRANEMPVTPQPPPARPWAVWSAELPASAIPVAFQLSLLGHDDREARPWMLRVEWRGHDRWAVTDGFDCLGAGGAWTHEPLTSARTDEWRAAHRFDLPTALHLADLALPRVEVHGVTAQEQLRRLRARTSS